MSIKVISEAQFNRWRNAWFGVTIVVFLSGNFWIYAVLTAILLFNVGKQESNPFALFIALLFAAPRLSGQIPGLGIVNFLFAIDYITILSFAVLFPAFKKLRKSPEATPFLNLWTDKLIFAYMFLDVVLLMRDTSVTDALRDVVINFTDVFLPYYVASRSIKSLQALKEVLVAYAIAGLTIGALAMFEYSRFWLLYSSLKTSLGVNWAMGDYLGRGDNLRALASLGQPIVLGYAMLITLGCYLFLSKQITSRYLRFIGWVLVLGGLYAPLSRGPWVGALILIVIFISMGIDAKKNLTKLVIASVMVLPLLSVIPGGEKIINLLPFIGKTDIENVEYRVKLLDSATIVFLRHPIFGSGSTKFYEELAALGMTQGEGIVDVVNSYLFEVLEHGLAGLSMFICFFIIPIISIYFILKNNKDKTNDIHITGLCLFASLIATMVTITSVSSILVLPTIYWSLGGMAVAYVRMYYQLESNAILEELRTYRLAFEALPVLPTSRIAFSSLTSHQIVVDTKTIPRIKLTPKPKVENSISLMPVPIQHKLKYKNQTNRPDLNDIYQRARQISQNPSNPSYFAKTLPMHLVSASSSEVNIVKNGKIIVISGSNVGRELILNKVLTKLGKSNVQVAVITKRATGYFLKHLQGKTYPIVNDTFIGERAQILRNHDVIEILGIKMKFIFEQ